MFLSSAQESTWTSSTVQTKSVEIGNIYDLFPETYDAVFILSKSSHFLKSILFGTLKTKCNTATANSEVSNCLIFNLMLTLLMLKANWNLLYSQRYIIKLLSVKKFSIFYFSLIYSKFSLIRCFGDFLINEKKIIHLKLLHNIHKHFLHNLNEYKW